VAQIGDGWFIDEGPPQKPAAHLYREVDGTRVVVDRQIDAYRLYANRCLMYEASRPEGRIVYVVWGGLTPLPIAASDLRRWRMDTDGLRRFDTPVDPDGRSMLTIEWLKYGDICYAAQTQPKFEESWSQRARARFASIRVETSAVDVNGMDSVGNSTLSDAAREGQIALVDELLRAGADVNSSNDAGGTVLMTSVAFRQPEVTRRLIRAGARLDAQDDRGETALMIAAQYRNLEMAEILLAAGADPAIRDDSGRTAAAWVPDDGNADLRTLRARLDRPAKASR
jgi:hypothetical protein